MGWRWRWDRESVPDLPVMHDSDRVHSILGLLERAIHPAFDTLFQEALVRFDRGLGEPGYMGSWRKKKPELAFLIKDHSRRQSVNLDLQWERRRSISL